MPIKLITEYTPSDSELQEAIEIRCSRNWASMEIANRYGGAQNVVWKILRGFSALELFQEAIDRELPFDTWDTALENTPLRKTPIYMGAMQIIEEEKDAPAAS